MKLIVFVVIGFFVQHFIAAWMDVSLSIIAISFLAGVLWTNALFLALRMNNNGR